MQAAVEEAAVAGFAHSCSEQTGRLLAALAGGCGDGVIAESGTGCGVGTAWLASGLGRAGRLVTVDTDPDCARVARRVHAGDPRIEVITGDWSLLAHHAPFDLFFCDGGGKQSDPEGVIGMLAPGGVLVLDDFIPSLEWPPRYGGRPDGLRLRYLCAPQLVAAEVLVVPDEACIVATRRSDRSDRPPFWSFRAQHDAGPFAACGGALRRRPSDWRVPVACR